MALGSTQGIGTLVAVYSRLVTPIVWMFLLSAVRVVASRKLRPRLAPSPGGA